MSKKQYENVDPKVNLPSLEEEMLSFWKENKIFEKSIEERPEDKQWTFLDGPPFITGLPHYGSLLSSIPKDLFPRFWTMKGYRVRRVWGWDCHGLPAENKVEDKLGLESKRDIEEKVGVKKFIEECKLYVNDVSDEWEWYVDHVGRWADFKNAYKTMDTSYMESVMWVFKSMYEKGHIYKGLRVSLYCPHCETPISNFEVAMDSDNYKEVTEPANVYKYELEDEKGTYLLAWSTTPWNKIATPALAVNPDLSYVKVSQGDENYILAENTLEILEGEYEVVEKIKGQDLVGKSFVAHYDYFEKEEGKRVFVIVPADFVSDEEGTGVVTIAAYGEEDLEVMKKENIQVVLHVEGNGHLKSDVPKWGGKYYLQVNKLVNEDLDKRGLVYKENDHTHTIPNCWRCQTRLFYSPQNAWYVDVQSLKSKMEKNNELVNWFPEHFKYGRFLNSMKSAPDWCISRSRYWGSPVPVWECECGERFVPGSIKELEERSGQKIDDLHKPEIDEVTVKCESCKKEMKRVEEVLDSWIEAGSAPFAERHFPFEEGVSLEDFFPPDFIVEYTGQIRAWFYVLHVISTALYDSNAFKNVVVTGVILGSDGRKMSKNYGNYPDPKEMLEKYGGDALRLYLMGSPVMRGEDILISEEQYKSQLRSFLLLLWNVYNFLVTYAVSDGWYMESPAEPSSKNALDRWILSRLKSLEAEVTNSLENYDTPGAVKEARDFISDLSQWYVRRSRDRVGPSAKNEGDKSDCYETLYFTLVTLSKLLAPITPFITEKIYKGLTNSESVHLEEWPKLDESLRDEKLEEMMDQARRIVERGHSARKEESIRVRQPLGSAEVKNAKVEIEDGVKEIILDELNLKSITIKVGDGDLHLTLDTNITKELENEGLARDLVRDIQKERKNLGLSPEQEVDVELPHWPEEFEKEIKEKVSAKNLVKGKELKINPLS